MFLRHFTSQFLWSVSYLLLCAIAFPLIYLLFCWSPPNSTMYSKCKGNGISTALSLHHFFGWYPPPPSEIRILSVPLHNLHYFTPGLGNYPPVTNSLYFCLKESVLLNHHSLILCWPLSRAFNCSKRILFISHDGEQCNMLWCP